MKELEQKEEPILIQSSIDGYVVWSKPKQETLEEAAERNHNEQRLNTYTSYSFNDAFKDGAKWQQERMYSEEDMQDFAKFCLLCKDEELPLIFPKDWAKHIKNKINK